MTDPPVKKHITTACTCCRRRKVKCDGAAPTCSNCKLYKEECTYKYGEDRRKLSLKKTNQALTERVKLLEDLLRSKGIEVPPDSGAESPSSDSNAAYAPAGGDDGKVSATGEDGNLDHDPGQMNGNNDWMSQFPDSSNGIAQASSVSWETFMGLEQGSEMAAPPVSTSQTKVSSMNALSGGPLLLQGLVLHGAPNTSGVNRQESESDPAVVFDEDYINYSANDNILDPTFLSGKATSGQLRRQSSVEWHNDNAWSNQRNSSQTRTIEPVRPTQSDEMIDQLSARMGSFQLAEDGQLRYFGATSNLHILHNGAFSLSRTATRSIRTEGNATLHRAGIGQSVDSEFEKHLEQLYFKWEDPAIHVVDEEMYYMEKEKYHSGEDGSPFYSETLKNAICAVGANLTSHSKMGLPEPVAEFFSSRAKALLEIEMDSPTVATVQALVIMSASEAAFTRDARGWIYSGMAVRLSADLGLHLDLSSHVQDGRLTSRELDVRRTTFWGVFVHDNMWSLYVGRPWGINIRDISIPRPSKEMDRLRKKIWIPHSDAGERPHVEQEGLLDPIETCADSNVSLCEMMRRLSRTLYAGRSLSDEALNKFASDMGREFDSWHQNLPTELAIDLSVEDHDHLFLPHVLQLHMQFYAISIFLHRPFFSRDGNGEGHQISRQAQQTCVQAAQAMVKLLKIYRKQHTLRQTNVQIVHLVFTASLIHIYNTCTSTGRESEKAMADLQFCCQSLSEIGQAYKNSTRALEVIICIKREWQNKARTVRLKRPGSLLNGTADSDPQRKRRATDDTQINRQELVRNEVKNNGGAASSEAWQFLNGDGQYEIGAFEGNTIIGSFPDTNFVYE